MGETINIFISFDALSVENCINTVMDDSCGGIATFIGTVRDNTKNKKVKRLEFEAYVPMAIKELNKIAVHAQEKWNTKRICILHRIGTLEIKDIAVAIAVSTPHRKDAFAACQYIIGTLKETVPIWKKEIFEDGEVWVSAHP